MKSRYHSIGFDKRDECIGDEEADSIEDEGNEHRGGSANNSGIRI